MMIVSDFDEINAFHNKDGTYTVELISCNQKFIMPHAWIDIKVTHSLNQLPEAEIKFTGEVDKLRNQ